MKIIDGLVRGLVFPWSNPYTQLVAFKKEKKIQKARQPKPCPLMRTMGMNMRKIIRIG
jgi:hypothetical protein